MIVCCGLRHGSLKLQAPKKVECRFLKYALTVFFLILATGKVLASDAGGGEILFSPLPPDADRKGAFNEVEAAERWHQLSLLYFGERTLIEGDEAREVVQLDVPSRTEDDAFVPVAIDTQALPGAAGAIRKLYLIIDVNPIPVAGVFSMAADRPLEQIGTRVRVNGYSYVRAIAETADGRLFMDRKMVKSRGVACAAPPITSPEEAAEKLGKMRFKFLRSTAADDADRRDIVQLMINHPNATGMQRDQVSLLYIQEHYVKEVNITFNDALVMQAETTFSISENPSFRFSFKPEEHGELKAEMIDTKGNTYVISSQVEARN